MGDDVPGPGEFGRALHDFLEASLALAPVEEPALRRRLREHLGGGDLEGMRLLTRDLGRPDLPNLQLALDDLLTRPGWRGEYVGAQSEHGPYAHVSMATLIAGGAARSEPLRAGPVEWLTIPLEPGRTIACAVNALGFMCGPAGPLATLVGIREHMGGPPVKLELLCGDPAVGERFLADLAEAMHRLNVYRGKVVSFTRTEHGNVEIAVRRLPAVDRDAIVLPAGVLERVERHALAPVEHRERLLAAGRHLKRGLLLHGPPGTGKTLTAMHLVGRMPGRTTVILSNQLYGLLGPACALARDLEPATVILEDVDLFAHARGLEDPYGPILFQLLNEMDGLAADADVLFLLTTNRPDVLEPALAERPGRIDQAVELPLPDAADRRRLIEVYSRGLQLRATRLDAVVERLEGASPAHIKELLRKAALLAAIESDGPLVAEDRHLEAALDDLAI
jgi:hypothetical protein